MTGQAAPRPLLPHCDEFAPASFACLGVCDCLATATAQSGHCGHLWLPGRNRALHVVEEEAEFVPSFAAISKPQRGAPQDGPRRRTPSLAGSDEQDRPKRRRSASAPTSPSRGPGNGILRAETGGRIQARTAGERSEFGSQTARRLATTEITGLLRTRNRVGLLGLDGGGRVAPNRSPPIALA